MSVEAGESGGRRSVFKPTTWAMSVPTLQRRDGRPDTVAHHVLLVMATYANPDGTSIRASVATLTKKSHLTTQKAVTEAMRRLEEAKLIIRAGELTGGTTVWRLNFDIEGDGAELYQERSAERRAADAERQRRRRKRLAEQDGHGLPERDVTGYQDVTMDLVSRATTPDVTGYHPGRHGVVARLSRGDDRDNRRSSGLHQPLTSPLDQPTNQQDGGTLPPDPQRTESPQAAPRTELEPEPERSKTTATQLDPESPVPRASRRERRQFGRTTWRQQRAATANLDPERREEARQELEAQHRRALIRAVPDPDETAGAAS